MKKLITFTIIAIMTLTSCGYVETYKEHLVRPQFENQHSIIVHQSSFNFHPSYKVFTPEYGIFMLPEDKDNGTIYDIRKTYNLFEDKYIIKNVMIGNVLTLTDEGQNDKKRDICKITDPTTDCTIVTEQTFIEKYTDYTVTVQDNSSDSTDDAAQTKYQVSITFNERDPKSPSARELHSTVMTFSQNGEAVLKLFKQQQYFKNNIEIFINDDTCQLTDDQCVALGVWFDQCLKNIGIAYRD